MYKEYTNNGPTFPGLIHIVATVISVMATYSRLVPGSFLCSLGQAFVCANLSRILRSMLAYIPKFPRRLQTQEETPILLCSWSLFLGLESPLGTSWIHYVLARSGGSKEGGSKGMGAD